MKPRLRSAALTAEDSYIFALVWARSNGDDIEAVIQNFSFAQDRRDADLMYECQWVWRAGRRVGDGRWMPWTAALSLARQGDHRVEILHCGGNITNCA